MPSRPDKTPPLAAVLDKRVDRLRTLLRRALRSFDVEAVHRARVATRRLKAAVDLLRPLLPEETREAFSKSLRKIRKMLGPMRDVDVMLQHVEAMRRRGDDRSAVDWLARRLRDRRADLRRRAARGPSARKLVARLSTWVDLEPEVRESQQTAVLLLRRVAPAGMRAFADRADRLARRLNKPGDDAPLAPEIPTDEVHELRVAAKALRYTIDLARPLGFDVPEGLTSDLKALQDALGLWHDYTVLTDEMIRLALESRLGADRSQTHGAVLKLARASWEEAQHQLVAFFRLWSAKGEALTARVESIFGDAAADRLPGHNGSGRAGAPLRRKRGAAVENP